MQQCHGTQNADILFCTPRVKKEIIIAYGCILKVCLHVSIFGHMPDPNKSTFLKATRNITVSTH